MSADQLPKHSSSAASTPTQADGAMSWATVNKTFRDFDRKARERVRVARAGGFDVAAVERANEEERAQVFEDVLAARTKPLHDLLAYIEQLEADPSTSTSTTGANQ